MPFVILVPHVPVSWAIALFCLAYFGQQSWSTLVMVLPTDLFPQSVVGSVAGLVGFGGAMGGIAFGEVVGYLLDHGFGYSTVFRIAGTLHIVAFLAILTAIPVLLPLRLERELKYQGVALRSPKFAHGWYAGAAGPCPCLHIFAPIRWTCWRCRKPPCRRLRFTAGWWSRCSPTKAL